MEIGGEAWGEAPFRSLNLTVYSVWMTRAIRTLKDMVPVDCIQGVQEHKELSVARTRDAPPVPVSGTSGVCVPCDGRGKGRE